jgi:acetyl-CoA C-acetyltransferase
MTSFKEQNKAAYELCFEAITEALQDSSLTAEKIDAIVLAKNDFMVDGEHQRLFGGILGSLFQKNTPIFQVNAACASGGVALWSAARMNYENILAVGVEKLSSASTAHITSEFLTAAESRYEQDEGVIFPAQYALVAQQYMVKHTAGIEDLALVAYKNHGNAALNEKAKFFGKSVPLQMIERSPVVCSPFRVFDCSISVDGAAAVVVSRSKSDIELAGSGMSTGAMAAFEMEDMTSFPSTIAAARDAYGQAAISLEEVRCAEVHDAFTSAELMAYEDLGFCKKGGAKELIREGNTKLNGSLPVNMSGGLKARGHPVAATGLAQVYELVKQMRNNAGKRQISNPKVAVAHNVGGCGTTAVVHVLRKT